MNLKLDKEWQEHFQSWEDDYLNDDPYRIAIMERSAYLTNETTLKKVVRFNKTVLYYHENFEADPEELKHFYEIYNQNKKLLAEIGNIPLICIGDRKFWGRKEVKRGHKSLINDALEQKHEEEGIKIYV